MPAAPRSSKPRHKVGDELRFDYQADVFQRGYRLIENLGKGSWRAEILPLTDEALDAMLAEQAREIAAIAAGRRGGLWMTDERIAEEIAEEGRIFEIRFCSAERYAEMF
jgi:hypothetical protein